MQTETVAPAASPPPGFVVLETSDEFHPPQIQDALDNIRHCLKRGLPQLRLKQPHNDTMVIVAGGPSLRAEMPLLYEMSKNSSNKLFAINDTHDFLMEYNITPWGFGMMEIAPWPKEFIRHANPVTKYFLASMAHPSGFDRLKDYDVTVFNAWGGIGEDHIVADTVGPGIPIVPGGEAISIRAINLGYTLGFRKFEMFGVDGCYRDDQTHVYMNRKVPTEEIWYRGRKFIAPYYLARQADDLRRFCRNFHDRFTLKCHGDGLVQYVHRSCWPEQYKETT